VEKLDQQLFLPIFLLLLVAVEELEELTVDLPVVQEVIELLLEHLVVVERLSLL
jgi:hypothetical protein